MSDGQDKNRGGNRVQRKRPPRLIGDEEKLRERTQSQSRYDERESSRARNSSRFIAMSQTSRRSPSCNSCLGRSLVF